MTTMGREAIYVCVCTALAGVGEYQEGKGGLRAAAAAASTTTAFNRLSNTRQGSEVKERHSIDSKCGGGCKWVAIFFIDIKRYLKGIKNFQLKVSYILNQWHIFHSLSDVPYDSWHCHATQCIAHKPCKEGKDSIDSRHLDCSPFLVFFCLPPCNRVSLIRGEQCNILHRTLSYDFLGIFSFLSSLPYL